VKVAINASVQSLRVSNVEKNKLRYIILSKQRGATSYVNKINIPLTAINYNGTNIVNSYSIDYAWDFQVQVVDALNTTLSIGLVANGKVTAQWGKDWMSIGKTYEKGGLDVMGQIYQNDGIAVAGVAITNGYPGIVLEKGAVNNYIRTPINGLLPYREGGHGTVGTAAWPFTNVHANNIYQAGKKVTTQEELTQVAVRTTNWISLKNNFEVGGTYTASNPYKITKTGTIKNLRILTKLYGTFEFYNVPTTTTGGLYFGFLRDGVNEYRLWPNASSTQVHIVYVGGHHKIEIVDLQYTL